MKSNEPYKDENKDLIPFKDLVKNFRRKDNFIWNASSNKLGNDDDCKKFAHDLEDIMRKYGVYVLSASIFADL